MLSDHHKKLLWVVVLVLVVFAPSFFADVYDVDDVQLMARLSKLTEFDLVTFIRGGSGLYYRPFIAASYKLDAFLFNANVYAMHAENIFLHVLNVILLVTILRSVFSGLNGRYLPYLCAVLWGIHPLTTESVNWISGRSDILASTFILIATVFLLRYRELGKPFSLFLMLVFFLCGVLTKEVMLPFFVLVVLLLRVQETELVERVKRWSLLEGKGLVLWLLPVVVCGIIFLRLIAFNSTSGRIVSTLRFMFNDIYYSLFVCLRAFGFYCKKVILPLPLNFAIMEVDPLYELLAILLVALCVVLLFKRDNCSALFLGGVALLTPAFLIAFGQIAWTPYAERYLYLPSAFMLPGIVGYFNAHLEFPSPRFKTVVVIMLVCVVAISTLHRNIIWHTNESIIADTARKSPYSRPIQGTYASILIESEQYDEAMIAINKARAIPALNYYPDPDILEAQILEKQGRAEDALTVLRNGAEKSKYNSKKNLQYLVKLLEKVSKTAVGAQRNELYTEIRELHLKLFKLNNNFKEIFNMAQLSTKLGDNERAIILFKQVLRNVNGGSSLALRAKSELARLENHCLE